MRRVFLKNSPREGYDIDALHGDLTQQQRDKVMGEFREKSLQLLIATDVAARGIDVVGITHVINYELPDDVEVYTHRSGRTGRAGNTGVCLSIITFKGAWENSPNRTNGSGAFS